MQIRPADASRMGAGHGSDCRGLRPILVPDPGDGPDMRERNFVAAAAVARWTVVLLLAIGLAACERSPQGQLPETSGEPVKAERAQVEGFALVRAYPDQSEDSLAIALEFSQPLVGTQARSEEHTSELQSLMRISYAVSCLNKTTIQSTKQ